MQWQEIREHYPQQWLLVEAIKAHSETNARVVEQLAVVESFSDSVTAMKGYTQLHRDAPERDSLKMNWRVAAKIQSPKG